MDNPLSKLALDDWYQVVMVVSVVVFLGCGTGLLKAFPTLPTALTSLGCFWVGLGEWVNHPARDMMTPANARFPAVIVSSHPRHPSVIGNMFLMLGVIFLASGIYKFIR